MDTSTLITEQSLVWQRNYIMRPSKNLPLTGVLSMATTLMPAVASTYAPPLKRMPRRAPLAMALRTTAGVEMTSAHGLAHQCHHAVKGRLESFLEQEIEGARWPKPSIPRRGPSSCR